MMTYCALFRTQIESRLPSLSKTTEDDRLPRGQGRLERELLFLVFNMLKIMVQCEECLKWRLVMIQVDDTETNYARAEI